MTTEEFTEKANLSKHQLDTWRESGLLEAKTINGPDGPRQEFDAGQLERARLLKALLAKGVSFARLAGADLAFNGQAFVVFDGNWVST
jgi:DNA-binding transcriptional MerR regulator